MYLTKLNEVLNFVNKIRRSKFITWINVHNEPKNLSKKKIKMKSVIFIARNRLFTKPVMEPSLILLKLFLAEASFKICSLKPFSTEPTTRCHEILKFRALYTYFIKQLHAIFLLETLLKATRRQNWQKIKQMLSNTLRLNFHSLYQLSLKNNWIYSKK